MAKRKVAMKRSRSKRSTFSARISTALKDLNSPNEIRRSYAVDRLVACKPETLKKYRAKRIVSSVAEYLQREHNPWGRRRAIMFLEKIGIRSALPLLKRSVFDIDRAVREVAIEILAERIGWKRTISFINKNFKNAGNVPSAFFSIDAHRKHRGQPILWHAETKGSFSSWGKDQWRSIKDQAPVFARTKGQLLEAVPLTGKNGKPFSVNGIPIFVGYTDLDYNAGGRYIAGFLMVDYRTKDQKDREANAWHEFGEIFSHKAGRAFEYAHLKKSGHLQEYSRRYPESAQGFREIIQNWERLKQ